MNEPVDHVERPRLPWRQDGEALTECGLVAVQTRAITRTDLARRLKEWGQQRTALTVCMTCLRTAERWSDWESDPRQALSRELEWEGTARFHRNRGRQLHDELRALALLVAAHREEFVSLVRGVQGTVDLNAERRKRGTQP